MPQEEHALSAAPVLASLGEVIHHELSERAGVHGDHEPLLDVK